jgi:hypothetical protein
MLLGLSHASRTEILAPVFVCCAIQTCRELQATCCRLLGDVLARMLAKPDSLAVLGQSLQAIISPIVECLEADKSGEGPASGSSRTCMLRWPRRCSLTDRQTDKESSSF